MSILDDIKALLTQTPSYVGEAATGAKAPYTVIRPLYVGNAALAVNGDALGWDTQYSVYCRAASVSASHNLALSVIGTLQGKRAGGSTLSASLGYNGAPVEGQYESQVTVQLNQGGLS
ncbi:tail terminator [Microbacterium phage Jemerald]|nr:tail terminator [Microbacterium phage Juicer]WNO27252.1 tail terminator [Microbacterium phage Jemerald]